MDIFNHKLGCSCSGCGKITNLPDDIVESSAKLSVGDKFDYNCPTCGPVEHILSATEKERMEAAKDYPGEQQFVHLHNHTIYSALDGVAKPEEYMAGCKECNQPAFAITDHGSVAAIPDAYFSAKKNNIKMIAGCEMYLNDFEPEFKEWQALAQEGKNTECRIPALKNHSKLGTLRADAQELESRFRRNRHLTVIAKNQIGYQNLITVQNIAWEKGFYYKPRVWYDLLKEHKEGLIVLSGCLNGPICHELREEAIAVPVSNTIRKRLEGTSKLDDKLYAQPKIVALEWIKQFREDFGDDFYLEIQMPGESVPNGRRAFKMITDISRHMKIKTVLTGDCHYLSRDDYNIQMVMMAVDQDKKVDDPTLFHVNSNEQFFKTRSQFRKQFIENKYNELATVDEFECYCDNTLDVASKCEQFKPNLEPKLPDVGDADKELIRLTLRGLKEKGLADKPEYVARMKLELQRFIEKKFSSYFLITADLCNKSRELDSPTGPARGSAGGSLVCYLLGIHEMDPIQWDLSFDRFLSPSRGGYMLNTTM